MVNISTEEKILKAAVEVFTQKGRHGAKMQEIADKAGINKAMLHYYFRSKEKLYVKVFREVFVKTFGGLHIIFDPDIPFTKALENFIDQYIDKIDKNPHIPLFIINELGEGAGTAVTVLQEALKNGEFKLPIAFLQMLNKALENNEIRKVDPLQFMISVIGLCVYYFIAEPLFTNVFMLVYKMENSGGFDRPKFIEQRKKAIFDLIYNGIKK